MVISIFRENGEIFCIMDFSANSFRQSVTNALLLQLTIRSGQNATFASQICSHHEILRWTSSDRFLAIENELGKTERDMFHKFQSF